MPALENLMKKFLLLLSCVVTNFAVYAQQHSAQGNTAYTIDPQATAAAPWKVGETIVEKPCSDHWKINCYLKFLGISTQDKALFQEFYASGRKATEPYTAILIPDSTERHRDSLYMLIMLYENGQKYGEGHYQNGKLHGLWTWWHENGQKAAEGHYQNGEPQGLWTYWHENGQKSEEGHCQDGELHGLWAKWHENGQKFIEIHYQNGKLQGLWTTWYENGQKSEEGHYQDGKKQGLWTSWDENGNIIGEKNYH